MRKQIAAANWKMNLSYSQGEELLSALFAQNYSLKDNNEVIIAVPFPYIEMGQRKVEGLKNVFIAAQNCSQHKSGAYTGEVAAEMLASLQIQRCIIGHSERREYFQESNEMLAAKIDICLANGIVPVFCCGEALAIRESGTQNEYVANQLEESLFHLSAEEISKVIIAYEPIWAIGTGKTASAEQAQEIHAYLRMSLAKKYGNDIANEIPILYGGSVKGSNAKEIFSQPDVDGGLVGGASLKADEFGEIIRGLK